MSAVTLHDEIADLERLLAGAPALVSATREPAEWLRAADPDEDEDDLFGDDDLGFDDVDEDELEEDDDPLDGDLDEEL
jgi:hypothetical protein